MKIHSCTRDHGKGFMVTYLELDSKGKSKLVKRCSYIIGTTNLNKAVLCGEFPEDKDLPPSFLPIQPVKI